jgi:hypothetical protein
MCEFASCQALLRRKPGFLKKRIASGKIGSPKVTVNPTQAPFLERVKADKL